METYGVVVPAYQAAAGVGEVVRACALQKGIAGVIVVDDGSTDGTAIAAEAAGAKVIRHERNRGKGAALVTAFGAASESGWSAAVTIDADGQHDPAEIPGLIACHEQTGADIVIGTRRREGTDMPWQRRTSNRMSSLVVSRLCGQQVLDSQSGYRLITRAVWERLTFTRMRYDMESELLIKAGRAGFRIAHAPIRTHYGDESSHFRPLRDTWRMVRLFLTMHASND